LSQKYFHEIRDPIHVFIRLTSDERKVVDSRPFQRLRHIHQLGLTSLVYPSATHKRFEHSLGVMELAGKVFDVITRTDLVNNKMRDSVKEFGNQDALKYWRNVLRIAALCHDLGHLPFSHAAEKELLPEGWNHEKLTVEIIKSDEMMSLWNAMTPPLRPDDIIKLAVGTKAMGMGIGIFSDFEAILAKIITGDSFGVDRIDYLLRDAHHAGVAYGKFDHHRLIDTLRILPPPKEAGSEEELQLGVEDGGLHSAEALLLARYFMFSQVYCHPIRRIYDIHLRDYLMEWLSEGKFSTELEEHLKITDNEITSAIRIAALDEKREGHIHAKRIIERNHFKPFYEINPDDMEKNPNAVKLIYDAACKEFGEKYFRRDPYEQKGVSPEFPVQERDGRVASSLSLSPQVLKNLPYVVIDYVFVDPEIKSKADKWLEKKEKI